MRVLLLLLTALLICAGCSESGGGISVPDIHIKLVLLPGILLILFSGGVRILHFIGVILCAIAIYLCWTTPTISPIAGTLMALFFIVVGLGLAFRDSN